MIVGFYEIPDGDWHGFALNLLIPGENIMQSSTSLQTWHQVFGHSAQITIVIEPIQSPPMCTVHEPNFSVSGLNPDSIHQGL